MVPHAEGGRTLSSALVALNPDEPDVVGDENGDPIHRRALLLRRRIDQRRRERRASKALIKAGSQALITGMKRQGLLLNPHEKAAKDLRVARAKKEIGKQKLEISEIAYVSNLLANCTEQQMTVARRLYNNRGVAHKHIKSRLPVAQNIEERLQRLRKMVVGADGAEGKDGAGKAAAGVRVDRELSQSATQLTTPCSVCSAMIIPSLMESHLVMCRVRHAKRQRVSLRVTANSDADRDTSVSHIGRMKQIVNARNLKVGTALRLTAPRLTAHSSRLLAAHGLLGPSSRARHPCRVLDATATAQDNCGGARCPLFSSVAAASTACTHHPCRAPRAPLVWAPQLTRLPYRRRNGWRWGVGTSGVAA